MTSNMADDFIKICSQESNVPAFVQKMPWRRPGGKPLSEPMLTQFTDAYMRHYGEMS